jgi:D-methionine transport system permease protein
MSLNELGLNTLITLGMTLLSTLLAYLVGIPLGVLLSVSSKRGIRPNKGLNLIVGWLVNILRSVPCLLLIIVLLPLTRGIFGTGTKYWYTMLVPLFFSSFPFVARMVEQSLAEVDQGEIEAVRSMGATDWDLVKKVLLAESRPSLISGVAVSAISILGYTAFAYDFGVGGLISQAYAFYTTHTSDFLSHWDIWVIIFLVVVIVQAVQELGLFLARRADKRRLKNL